jgi:hypothetical protein
MKTYWWASGYDAKVSANSDLYRGKLANLSNILHTIPSREQRFYAWTRELAGRVPDADHYAAIASHSITLTGSIAQWGMTT